MSEAHWYWIDGVASVRHPRTYNLAKDEERASFIEDYRQTAAASLLKWVIARNEHLKDDEPLLSESGKIPVAVFNFAILQCQKHARFLQHRDIDDDRVGGAAQEELPGEDTGLTEGTTQENKVKVEFQLRPFPLLASDFLVIFLPLAPI